VQANGRNVKKCQCLHVLGESVFFCEAVAQYQFYFGRKKREEQQRMVVQSIQSSLLLFDSSYAHKYASMMFPLPFILAEDDCMPSSHYVNLREAKICRDALIDVLGIGRTYWKTCMHHAINNSIPEYKLKGKKTNWKRRWDEMHFDSLVEHFEELRKEAGPIATRFVRERTGETTTRDHNEQVEGLPPSISKRQCYYNYCFSRGVKVTSNNKGNMVIEPTEDSLPIPSWGSYLSFWSKEYSSLRVSNPTEDICSYCYQFQNSFRYQKRAPTTMIAGGADSDGEEGPPDNDSLPLLIPPPPPICLPTTTEEVDSSGDEAEMEEQEVAVEEEEVVVEDDEVGVEEQDVDEEVLQREKQIEDTLKHVKMARAQRVLVNEKMSTAKEDAAANTIHSDRTYTFIVDYGQNMTLPSFGNSQPGDTYYYTPLTIFNLGVVDVSHPDGEHLYCHLYKEGDGKKGGDNVASLLMKTLRQLNVLQEGCRGKELNVVFDNCPGQNKNHHVLWLVPYLIEMGYFHTVNFIFLVVGHTKNAADRRFNNLKMIYRKSNVYTFNQLVEVCGKSPHVTVVPVVDGDFKDYDYFFDLFYGKISAVTKSHIFSCKRPSNDSVYTDGVKLMVSVKESNLDEHSTKTTNLLTPKMMLFNADGTEGTLQEAVASRLSLLQRADFLDHLPFKGIPEFKQVQLYKNYRKLLYSK
jgi:hypothetical protein